MGICVQIQNKINKNKSLFEKSQIYQRRSNQIPEYQTMTIREMCKINA